MHDVVKTVSTDTKMSGALVGIFEARIAAYMSQQCWEQVVQILRETDSNLIVTRSPASTQNKQIYYCKSSFASK